jgi:hypothetical protein
MAEKTPKEAWLECQVGRVCSVGSKSLEVGGRAVKLNRGNRRVLGEKILESWTGC